MSEKEKLVERILYSLKVVSTSYDAQDRVVELDMAEKVIDTIITDWLEGVDNSLTAIIKDWEARVEDDKSLFSLGVRRAQDVIRGENQVP